MAKDIKSWNPDDAQEWVAIDLPDAAHSCASSGFQLLISLAITFSCPCLCLHAVQRFHFRKVAPAVDSWFLLPVNDAD